MLISVVMPVYNGAPFLRAALNSILAQDIEFELIISDDGSTDDTVEAIESIDDKRLRFFKNPSNAGIFGNLNRCIERASGSYIQVFCQDDLMKKGYLAAQLEMLRKHPDAGLVYGNPEYINEFAGAVTTSLEDRTPEVVNRDLYVWIASHYGALPASLSSIMFPRRTIETIGLFNAAFRVAGDLEFYHRVAERFPIVRDARIFHSVRSHSKMASVHSKTGGYYLQEELALDAWSRALWSGADYRKLQYFRSAVRGNYHLSWIMRAAMRGELMLALKSLAQLNRIYPLNWVLWWRIARAFGKIPAPLLPAPPR